MATKSKDSDLNDLEWLNVFYKSAREIGEIAVDDFATIKRRVIDVNEVDLREGSGSNSLVTRNAVKNFVQSITKSLQNLGELKIDVFREFKNRYPNLEGDWLSENCATQSSSVESPNNVDSHPIKNGEVSEECERESVQMELDISKEEFINPSGMSDKEDESHVTDETAEQTRSLTPTGAITSPEVAPIEENQNVINNSKEPEETEVLNKCKPVVDDQVPGPSRLSHLSSRRMARVKKREFEQVPMADSSDSDYETPNSGAKKLRRANVTQTQVNKSKTKTIAKSKQPICTRRGPLSRRRKDKVEQENSEKEESDGGATNITNDYWKVHDFKQDAKLKIKARVLLEGLKK